MMKIRNKEFDFDYMTYVMGILNVTPDSFSDGGLHNKEDEAVAHALKMIEEGAAIIDIGGESTRPGFERVTEEEELRRVIPVIRSLRKVSDIPISIDTTKPNVAAAAIEAGADIINTVEGVDAPCEMIEVVKSTGAPFIMTYEKGYADIFEDELIKMAKAAEEAGIDSDKIIVDPGIGFGKTQEENLKIINVLPMITRIPYPVLLGCSRKSVIGNVLNVPVSERLPGTIVTTVLACLAKVGIVRVHDVSENVNALKMMRAIIETEDEVRAERNKNGSYNN